MQVSVYLAGKMSGLSKEQMTGWREKAKRQLRALGYLVHDPCETSLDDNKDPRMIVMSNLFQLSKSDLVLMEFAHPDKSPGTFSELGVCVGAGKPVIVFTQYDRRSKPHSYAKHPWIVGGAAGVYETVDDAIEGIVNAFPIVGIITTDEVTIYNDAGPIRTFKRFEYPEGIEG